MTNDETEVPDPLEIGLMSPDIGALIDAEMGPDSARLNALLVQQQLGGHSLNIANTTLTKVLSLFA